MKLSILNSAKTETGKKELPPQFSELVRTDLIRKAVFAIQANSRQAYGASPEAGKRASAKLSRRRKKYRGSYGIGISRVPRKILSRRGTRMFWVGAFAPGTVGGRRAHPPKAEKIWTQKLNINERRKAIRSALAATLNPEIVSQRGHIAPEGYPFIIDNSFEDMQKTKDIISALKNLGLEADLERSSVRKIRSGKGKQRGRRYVKKIGPLIVVSSKCSLRNAAKNIPGVEIVFVDKLNCQHLAPGTYPGRLTLFTQAALDRMEKNHLFSQKAKKAIKPKKATARQAAKKAVKKAK